jgi:cation:H+ antiporter
MTFALLFLASGAVVVVAGIVLAKSADGIADATGWGRVWVGSVLLAFATSLPELATDVSAVRLESADLAAGDLFGSSLANMLILAVVDLLYPRKQVLIQAAPDHALMVCLAVLLTAVAALGITTRPETLWFGISPVSIALLAVYAGGTWVVFRHVSRQPGLADTSPVGAVPGALRRAVLQFVLAAVVILGAAPVFAWSAKGVAEITGLGATFTGTLLVGFATSLPELVSTLAAVRMGAFDLAVGNLFGSNAFNMVIFAVLDPATPDGPIYGAVRPEHVLTALSAIGLMCLGLAAIMYRAKRRFALIEPDSLLILAGYAASLLFLYAYAAGT